MIRILAVAALMGGFSLQSQAADRALTCKLSLPENKELTFSDPLVGGKARIQHPYRIHLDQSGDREYEIEAQVWGFQDGVSGRKAGYLSVTQVKEKIDSPMNYAVNHCEQKSAKEGCALELVTVLNGVGFHVVCELPAE